MSEKVVLGIDIGGTNTAFGLVSEKGKILVKRSIPTRNFSVPQHIVSVIAEQAEEWITAFKGEYEMIGTGIGAPNANYFTGKIEYAPNLEWKGVIPLAAHFSERLQHKALLINDAKAAALGEMSFGGAKGMKNFIVITLGTGLGSGIVMNGDLVFGKDGMSGELGHTIVERNGRTCGCGRRGCLEMYCSATGIGITYTEMLKRKNEENSFDQKKNESKYIFEKAMAGDQTAKHAFYFTGKILGQALANCASITGPDTIFLFGGLAKAGDLIFAPAIEYFEQNLFYSFKNKIKILPSQLKENDPAILGAAALIWSKL